MTVNTERELRTELKDFVDAWTATMESSGVRVEKGVEHGEVTNVVFHAPAARLTIVAAYDGFWGELERVSAPNRSITVDFFAGTLPDMLARLQAGYCGAPEATGKRPVIYDMTSVDTWYPHWVSVELADFVAAWSAVMRSRGIRTERLSVKGAASYVSYHAEQACLEIFPSLGGYRARLSLALGRRAIVHFATISRTLSEIQAEYDRLFQEDPRS